MKVLVFPASLVIFLESAVQKQLYSKKKVRVCLLFVDNHLLIRLCLLSQNPTAENKAAIFSLTPSFC